MHRRAKCGLVAIGVTKMGKTVPIFVTVYSYDIGILRNKESCTRPDIGFFIIRHRFCAVFLLTRSTRSN